MNSYHLSIKSATSNGRFIELCDLWRNYHPLSNMADNEYQNSDIDYGLVRSEVTRNEERRNVQTGEKRLYVPVTRKVTDTDDSKPTKSMCKVSLTYETGDLPKDHVFF